MYNMKFGASRRARSLREDLVVDPLMSPALDPMTDPLAAVDPLLDVVADVVAVEALTKRYRATVTRTVTETALVEFDAPETADLHTMAEALLPQIPPEAWVESPADSWGYIDRIEPVEASVEEPPSPDMVLSDEMAAEEDELDPFAPSAALSRHRRRRLRRRGVRLVGYRANPRKARRFARRRHSTRMTADEVTLSVQDILAQADEIFAVAPTTSAEATAQFDGLIELENQLITLETTVFDGTAPEAEAVAYEMISSALTAVADMIASVEASLNQFMIGEENIGASVTDPFAEVY